MKKYLANAFSLQMLKSFSASVKINEVEVKDIPQDVISCIGHVDTANVLSNILGFEVACNRVSLTLNPDDILYVAQVVGGRLPEGATKLPDGFNLKFLKIEVKYN